jgi:hypothetical protein
VRRGKMKIKCHCRTCNEVFELNVDIQKILNKKKREEKFLELMIRLSENEHVKTCAKPNIGIQSS